MIIKWTRAILHSQGLPSKLWAEVLNAVQYLYTLGPVHALKDNTPAMIFQNHQGDKPNIDHLQILGCAEYVHINKQLCTKLDAKSTKCILVGDGDDCKAYHIWNPKTEKIYYSKDVIFDETQIRFKDADGEDKYLLDTENIDDLYHNHNNGDDQE